MGNAPSMGGDMSARDLIEKARVYRTHGGRYVVVKVFSKSKDDMTTLCDEFGGNFYAHGVGYIWVLSSKRALTEMVRALAPNVPDSLSQLL
jgi:hypothetical protein